MLNNNIWCIIMAGGGGTRFWPVSTADTPKQFVQVGETGLNFLQWTFRRFDQMIPAERTLVVTSSAHEDITRACMKEIPPQNILVEPHKRDTAACVAYAMYTILQRDPDAVMVVVPSDHIIPDQENFEKSICAAAEYAQSNDVLMTIGVHPTRPDTNYGYIQGCGEPQNGTPMQVKTFTEKPDAELARVFVQSGEFLWNSGIFVWKASVIKKEIEQFLPHIAAQFDGWEQFIGSAEEGRFIEKAYAECKKISIDYGVMEKTSSAWVYPADFTWYDIGTWESMYSFMEKKDACGNASNTPVMAQDAHGNLLLSESKDKLIAVCGLDNYSVIDTGKVLLVCPRDDAKFREFLSNLAYPEFEKYR